MVCQGGSSIEPSREHDEVPASARARPTLYRATPTPAASISCERSALSTTLARSCCPSSPTGKPVCDRARSMPLSALPRLSHLCLSDEVPHITPLVQLDIEQFQSRRFIECRARRAHGSSLDEPIPIAFAQSCV